MSVKGRLRAKARKKARKAAKKRGGLVRKKVSRLSQDKTLAVDYKDPKLLRLYLSETGKIIPRRISGNTREAAARDHRRPSSGRGTWRCCPMPRTT